MPARRKKNPNLLLRRFLTLVFLVLLLGGIWKIFSAWQNRLWDGESRFTVVVATENPKVYSFNPKTGELVIVTIAANTQIEAARGYGSWLVGSLWELGQQESLQGELLADSLKKSMGIPVDGWIDKRGEALFTSGRIGLPTISTNLTFFDRWQVLMQAKVSRANRRKIDLASSKVLKEVRLPDGLQGFEVIPEQAKLSFESLFRDDAVFTEAKTLSVINTSSKQGLASQAARLAAVLGVRVISVKNAKGEVEGCVIRGNKEDLASLSARRLAELLGCAREEGAPQGAQLELLLSSSSSS